VRQLKISRNGLELAAVSLAQPVSTLGRSPSCDGVLRAPGVKPVHFLLEAQGSASGQWVLFDISNDSGEGVVLETGKTEFKGFFFELSEGVLDSPEEMGGAIRRNLQGQGGTQQRAQQRLSLVEAVRIRRDSGAVQEVSHLPISGPSFLRVRKLRPFEEIAGLKLLYRKGGVAIEFQATRGGPQRVTLIKNSNPGEVLPGASVELGKSDWIRMEYGPDDLYFRWVSPVARAPIPREVVGNPILRIGFLVGFLVAGGTASWVAYKIKNPSEAIQMPPPRIAKIEVKEAPPPPPVSESLSRPKSAQSEAAGSSAAPRVAPKGVAKTRALPARPGLVAPVPPTDVNQLGLLGALKSKAPKQGEGVRADQIFDEGMVSQAAGAKTGSIALKTPPSGALDLSKAGGQKTAQGDGLQALATTLSGKAKYSPSNVGAVVSGSGGKLLGSGLEGLGKNSSLASGKGGGESLGLDDGSDSEVQGGLDRETVRRVIKSNRGKIRACYERALLSQPQLAGRVVTLFEVSAKGTVLSASVKASDVQSQTLESCLVEVVRGMAFPSSPTGASTKVSYPFVFQARGN
jgi:hypothetical protein